MKKLLMTAAVAAVALGLGATASLADKYKACWVYVGPVGDGGYTFQHDVGRKMVDKELGDKVETVFVENVAEADADRAIERLARDGCKIIFTTSFGFMDPTLRLPPNFPT